MTDFDVLDKNQTILGNLLIEASAGTGKTFTIEHTVLRLIKEEKIPLHKILLLTFTEASQKDLMVRVLGRLKKESFFGFLEEMPILTFQKFIHRFLNRKLEEANHPPLHIQLEHFLRTLEPYKEFGPNQLFKLLFAPKTDSDRGIKDLGDKANYQKDLLYFDEALSQIAPLIHQFGQDNFYELIENFKNIKEEDREIFDLFFKNPKKALDRQICKKNSGFKKLVPENIRAKKTVVIPAKLALIPTYIEKLADPNMQLTLLKKLVESQMGHPIQSFSLEFDLFLKELEDPFFADQISKRFEAVIVDEFQDTDPRQWEILSKLFFKKEHIRTFMVVGDPKQSIYRFRNADYASFFSAKNSLEAHEIYQLNTSYRSSQRLTFATNQLFESIPNPFEPIDYIPVLAGRKDEGLLHPIELVVFEEKLGNKEAVKTVLYPWLLSLLHREEIDHKKTAILVNNRYEASEIELFLTQNHVPVKRVDKTPLKDRLCFQQFTQLLKLLQDPFDQRALKSYHFIVKKELIREGEESLSKSFIDTVDTVRNIRLKALENDLNPFLLAFDDTPLFPLLLKRPLCSIEDVSELYEEIYYSNASSDPDQEKTEGVELITTFSSKGLEYDTTIALSLSTDDRKKELSEEDIYEKRRLLYVACTRSREKLIIPVVPSKPSTMTSFLEKLGRDISIHSLKEVFKDTLIHVTSYTFEEHPKKSFIQEPDECLVPFPFKLYPKKEAALSFSSMDFSETEIEKALKTPDELPLGAESGTFIHKILEKIFNDQSKMLDDSVIEPIVDKALLLTPFAPYKEYILKKVRYVLNLPIEGKLLKEVHPFCRITESPFSFNRGNERVEGVFDLLLFFENKIHIIDYKLTHPRSLSTKELMEAFHYDEQGKLYKEAIQNIYPSMKDQVEMHFIFLRNEVHYVL
jgi:ATP-dependent exoDNAse (exonuclease V) beta subunit